jgi:type I restriction enzyme S subunit
MSASKWKPYPEYRVIPHAGINKIPNHWNSKRVRYVFRERGEISEDGTEELLSVSKYTGVKVRSTTTDREARAASLVGYKKCEPNDIVSNIMLAWDSALGVAFDSGIVSSAYEVYVPQQEIDPHFLDLLLRTPEYRVAFTIVSKGIVPSRWRMYTESFNDIQMILPPLSEQKQIGRFVSRVDENISRNIGHLETQISLLEEKRSALITQVVTKGLNPDAPMKNSGIDWIGEIPEHWTIKRIKHIGKLRGGAGFPDQEQGLTDEEIPFHKVNALGPASSRGLIVENTNTISPETASRLGAYVFPKDTIVFAKVGAALLLKRFCLLSEPSCIDNNMMGFIIDESKENVAFIQNSLANISFDKIVNPGAVPSVNGSQIGAIPLAIPPRSEQNKIMEYLLIKTTFFDNVKFMLSRKIDLLKEYKTALISAVVTGKIDVRSL